MAECKIDYDILLRYAFNTLYYFNQQLLYVPNYFDLFLNSLKQHLTLILLPSLGWNVDAHDYDDAHDYATYYFSLGMQLYFQSIRGYSYVSSKRINDTFSLEIYTFYCKTLVAINTAKFNSWVIYILSNLWYRTDF